MDADEDIFHASPQSIGKASHASVDNKTYSNRTSDILSLPIISNELGIMGKIDVYKADKKELVERKYQLKQIYKGQIYQLWAQYFCLVEMGYEVGSIAFYEIATNTSHPISLPTNENRTELCEFIERFKNFNPEDDIIVNYNKCVHCVYCNLCDKTDSDNVYT